MTQKSGIIITLIILFLGVASSLAFAATRAIILPGDKQAFITVQEVGVTGVFSDDPKKLFDLMNVPEKDISGGGKGKIVQASDKSMILSCVYRISSGAHYTCEIIIKKSSASQISSSHQTAFWEVSGNEALALHQVLVSDANNEVNFLNLEKNLSLTSNGDSFALRYQPAN
jgi:hypothetical protein